MFPIAALARCVPADLDNQFVSPAISATFFTAMLALVAAFYWLLAGYRRIRRHRRFVRMLRGIAIIIALADIAIADAAVWTWLQARSFIPWCAPVSDSRLDVQQLRLQTVTFVSLLVFIVAICLVGGSSAAIGASAIIRMAMGKRAASEDSRP